MKVSTKFAEFRPAIAADDWERILEALRIYSHHKDYRALYETLAAEPAVAIRAPDANLN
ncbi:hypothetical protein [Paracoccus laeviglucosivorans]|uniref:Uncharacterized protein n=1 Tax=Paracoccus laeviglucosivorans TaxID=1197861 RepID=A0A521EQC1_9RHOB|nr:hypothetical protein [Paracoccus laeviglucosivorans]SMO86133.1 hypothetical protein SAMN06265221_114102 [Paracoccus laeviglucosivorans]